MQNNLNQRLKQYKEAKMLPEKLSELHYNLAYDYGLMSDYYSDQLAVWTTVKRELTDKFKTVAAAEREFDQSEFGIEEQRIKLYLKAVEKLLAGVKLRLQTLSEEAKNQY